jgi:hypothetical protein
MQSEELVGHLREALAGAGELREVRMFGGLCFMLDGNMVAGASPRGLLLRVGKEKHAEAILRPGAKAMEMGGREMAGYVVVDAAGLDERALRDWVAMACAHVRTLPRKASAKASAASSKRPPAKKRK